MSTVRVYAWYERPEPQYVTINVPDDIPKDSREYNEYIEDFIPCQEVWATEWEIRND